MRFYDVWTIYKEFGKKYGYSLNPNQFYRNVVNEYMRLKKEPNTPPRFDFIPYLSFHNAVSEQQWYKNNMPYYNVWPGVFDTFIKTRLDIKAKLLKFAHPSFAIRIPIMDEPLLSFKYQGYNAWIESLIILGEKPDQFYDTTGISIKAIYRIDHPDHLFPGTFNQVTRIPEDCTIEEGFTRDAVVNKDHNGVDYSIPSSIVDACCRLTVAVAFLSTGSHKILEYDVLSKHLDAYRAIRDEKKRKEYEDKAKEKGKFGWNIGHGRGDRHLQIPRGISYEQACREAGGRELLYQHVRGGHWHTVRCGAGKEDIKVVWFEDTVVRKDLPPKPLKV